MKHVKNWFIGLIATLMVGACTQEEIGASDSEAILTFTPSVVSTTRSAMESGFQEGDEIGIYLYDGQNYTASTPKVWKSNLCLTYASEGAWPTTETIYWQSIPYEKVSCVAYYPYQSADNSSALSSISITTETNQSALSGLRSCDFLWAKVDSLDFTRHAHGIPLQMEHLMSKVKVTFSNFNETVSECTLQNIGCIGTIDLINGTVVKSTSENNRIVTMYYDNETATAEAVILPQTVSTGIFIRFSYKDNAYTYSLSSPLELNSGNEYLISIDGSTL